MLIEKDKEYVICIFEKSKFDDINTTLAESKVKLEDKLEFIIKNITKCSMESELCDETGSYLRDLNCVFGETTHKKRMGTISYETKLEPIPLNSRQLVSKLKEVKRQMCATDAIFLIDKIIKRYI